MNEQLVENCDFDEDELASFRWESDHITAAHAQNHSSVSDQFQEEDEESSCPSSSEGGEEEVTMDPYAELYFPDDTETEKRENGGKRAFQSFWCGPPEESVQPDSDFPKPDTYGLHSRSRRGVRRRRRSSSGGTTVRNRFYFETDTVFETGRTGDVQYAPKRPPPILDFVFIFTAFVAALIFAYYFAV